MKSREELDLFGRKLLGQTRAELFLEMRFMAEALDSLSYVMDLNTQRLGTEGSCIHFNPLFLFRLYVESPQKLARLYIHIILHCLFRHVFSGVGRDARLWDLCCDIHAEWVLDSMHYPLIERPPGEFRSGWYDRISEKAGVVTAERLYRMLSEEKPDYETMELLEKEFQKDDHRFWEIRDDGKGGGHTESPPPVEGLNPPASPLPDGETRDGTDHDRMESHAENGIGGSRIKSSPSEGQGGKSMTAFQAMPDAWKDIAEKMDAELSLLGREASEETGSLSWYLHYQCRKRTDFRDFLRKISVFREENVIDPDSFDYGLYYYGMELYGNMPLLSENEFREARKIESLVIAIDTSASCKETLVQDFLNETAGLLLEHGSFFKRVEILILECDEKIQKCVSFHDPEEMRSYVDSFELKGGFGTDFRPVFSYIDDLRRKGGLPGLRGLLYFTDGYGRYPEKARDYLTAFVFPGNAMVNDDEAPGWALKLYINEDGD